MKNAIIICGVFLLISCDKDHPLQSQLEGEWKWDSTSSGWGFSNSNTSDTQWRLSITSSNIVSAREGSTNLVQSSSYYIEVKESYMHINSNEHLYGCSGKAFRFHGDTMILFSPHVFDGNKHLFIRL